MIVTIVRFPTSATASLDAATQMFAGSAATYLEVPGLLGKIYLRAEDGSVGGVYWWTERHHAEGKFTQEWRNGVTEKYGAPPIVEFFDAPVVVDSILGAVRTETPQVFHGQDTL
ncbi:MAG: monooxygenase [Acidimicrobiales bacterium]|nr:monooxygenase [Acidimicrobiales bacterium]